MSISVDKLGGEVNVIDMETEEEGAIDLGPSGFAFRFGQRQVRIVRVLRNRLWLHLSPQLSERSIMSILGPYLKQKSISQNQCLFIENSDILLL